MPEPTNKWFNPKGSTVQQTEPSRPIKELQLDERFDKLESALIHPFKSIENIEKHIENEQALIERLVQDNLIRRSFQDTPISIGLNVSYQLEYHRHLYVYLYSNTGFTLQVSTGATQVIPANYWTNVSYPRGSYFTVSGGSDTAQQVCWVRACDVPMEMATQQVAIPGNVNVTQGTSPWVTSGTVTANQGGTWTVQPGNTPNTQAWLFVNSSDYPQGATPITATSGNIANAAAVATLPAAAGIRTWISGFEVTGSGATVGLPVTVTVTGTINGSLSYTYSFVAGALIENTPLIVSFKPAIPTNAVNSTIVVTCPASGAGGTNNVVNAHGYQL